MLLLEVEDLHAGYGRVPVLQGVSFQLREDEALGIVGHNGMGKSTLLKTLVGLVRPTRGRIVMERCQEDLRGENLETLYVSYMVGGENAEPGEEIEACSATAASYCSRLEW